MSAKMANTFYDTLAVLDTLSQNTEGMTVGQLRKVLSSLTVGQTGRMLGSLELCGFVARELKPYGRTGKIVYHMTESAAIMLSSIARQYAEKR